MNYTIEDISLSFNRKMYTYYVQKICKKCNKQKSSNYKQKHKEEITKQRSEYYKTVKEDIKLYRKKNPDIVKKARINFYNRNKKYIIKNAMYNKALRRFLFRKKYRDKYEDIIGCTPNQFRKWIESQFVYNMSFDNYNKVWELDHVLPQILFNLFDDKEAAICNNWRNIRPHVVNQNKNKKDKLILYDIVLQELKIYHLNNESVLFQGRNFFERPQLIAVPNSKKLIHRENLQPSS
jgi:hypothetical protein